MQVMERHSPRRTPRINRVRAAARQPLVAPARAARLRAPLCYSLDKAADAADGADAGTVRAMGVEGVLDAAAAAEIGGGEDDD